MAARLNTALLKLTPLIFALFTSGFDELQNEAFPAICSPYNGDQNSNSFLSNCRAIFAKLGPPKDEAFPDKLSSISSQHEIDGHEKFEVSTIRTGNCKFTAVGSQTGATISHVKHLSYHYAWANLWPTFEIAIDDMMENCVKNGLNGAAVIHYSSKPAASDAFQIELSLKYLPLSSQFWGMVQGPQVAPESPSTSPEPSPQFDAPQSLSNDTAIDIPSDAPQFPNLLLPQSRFAAGWQKLRGGICHACNDCWENPQKLLRLALLIYNEVLRWGVYSPLIAENWRQHQKRQLDPSSALPRQAARDGALAMRDGRRWKCTSEESAFVADLTAWQQAHPKCPDRDLQTEDAAS